MRWKFCLQEIYWGALLGQRVWGVREAGLGRRREINCDVVLFFVFFFSSGPHLWHMKVPRLGVKPELKLPNCTIAQQYQIQSMSATYTTAHSNTRSFNLLSKARDWIHILWVLAGFLICWATAHCIGTSGAETAFWAHPSWGKIRRDPL